MKKREMAKVLQEAYDNNYDFDYNAGPMINWEGILDELVEAGMLPPCNFADEPKRSITMRNIENWCWEPEDKEEIDHET